MQNEPMQPSYQSSTPPMPPVAPGAPQPTPEPSKRRNRLVVVLVVAAVLVAALGGGAWWLTARKSGTSSGSTGKPTNDALPATISSQTLTPASVQNIDKEAAFYAYLKAAAEQQQVIITKGYNFATTAGAQEDTDYVRTGYDYATKKLVQAHDTVNADGSRDKSRCVNGTQYTKVAILHTWKTGSAQDSEDFCSLDTLSSDVNDGFNTGGLTAQQAERFVSYLRRHKGLITVSSLTLDQHAGKQYLHFTVQLQPISTGTDSAYLGAQWLMWAFKETGLDPTTYPYEYVGAGGDGLLINYFVDPAAKLPAYATIDTTAQKDHSGKDLPMTNYDHYRVQYQFGAATFDASTANDAPVTITW